LSLLGDINETSIRYQYWENKKEHDHENFYSFYKFSIWYFCYSDICERF